MNIDILLFENFETLDAMGPAEVFSRFPELYRISCRSLAGGVVTSSQKIGFVTASFFDSVFDSVSGSVSGGASNGSVPDPAAGAENVLLIPGGMGTRSLVEDVRYIAALKKLCEDALYVLTVCTGSMLLAKTGLLDGRQATTNKIAFEWASSQGKNTRWLKSARWVADGKYYTSSGVSAGIDMTLGFIADLRGKATAAEAARQMEYVWNEDKENDPFALKD
ncbi:MAG: DJ-1/PfpI family protein [Synergistaceae bacterium]|nr:DJ-1/PfpI family protein [Synergistaceae bacterium]